MARPLGGLMAIAVDELRPAPHNPRERVTDIEGLAASIREVGMLQPILVQSVPGESGYQVVAGHRRLAAAKHLGQRDVPCIVRRDMLPDEELLYLGRAIGLSNIYNTIHGRGDGLVLRRTAERTNALYDRLSMTPNQPSRTHDRIAAIRSRNYAAANGWLAPLAWDDDAIDDPAHSPQLTPAVSILRDTEVDEAAVYRRMHGDRTVRLSRADAAELVRRCREAGWSWVDIERRAGLKAERYLPAAQEAS